MSNSQLSEERASSRTARATKKNQKGNKKKKENLKTRTVSAREETTKEYCVT